MNSSLDVNKDECVNIKDITLSVKSLKRKLESPDESSNSKKEVRLENNESIRPKDNFEETEYYFENGLRKVYPYYFTFATFCKGRWVGKSLCEVFAREFRAYTKEHYEKQIQLCLLKVNNVSVNVDYVLKDNDHITHKIHRHEVAVMGGPIKIIHSDDDIIVVDKPPSIPVHPCGRYRYNTILYILSKEYGLRNLHTVHRLDRLTSGILLFTKTLRKSQEIDECIRSHLMRKEYLCRVEGVFPDEIITCSQPIETLSKIGVCIVSSLGKESKTEFKKLSYNGRSSLVLCKPFTGRMHQIRVHLQYLGYPIINDPLYNHKEVFGPKKGKDGDVGKSKEQLINDLMAIHHLDNWLKCDDNKKIDEENEVSKKTNEILRKLLNHNMNTDENKKLQSDEKYNKNSDKIIIDATCHFCQKKYKDPEPKDLLLFLHAYKYKSDKLEFQTDFPVWAQEEWKDM